MNQPGTVDSSFRGEVGVLLLNMSPNHVAFPKGERIAQAVFNKYETASFDEYEELQETIRGEGGFGSTNEKPIIEIVSS
jgi:dUTP pyrophosphatase